MMSGRKERALFRAAVFVVVKNDDNEYLLQRRSGTGFLDGYYDISGSGHLEYGESLQACGIRELEEETGLIVEEKDLRLVAVFQSAFERDINYLNVVFSASKFSGQLVNGEPTKISELGWYRSDALPSKLTIGLRVFFESLKEGKIVNYYIDPTEYKAFMGENFE